VGSGILCIVFKVVGQSIFILKKSMQPNTPLLFLHGFLGTAADWDEVIAHLPHPCFALNLPGHGDAPFREDIDTVLLDAIERIGKPHLIGYSMGGRLALQFAARHRSKIEKLILLSAHPGLTAGHQERLTQDRTWCHKLKTRSIDEFLQDWYDQPIFKTLVAKMDIRTFRQHQRPLDLAYALEAFSLAHQPDLSHVPAHFLVGELDAVYRAHYKKLPHHLIAGAGHAAHLENPKAVAGVIHDLCS